LVMCGMLHVLGVVCSSLLERRYAPTR
jgi:hypothetical protein